MPISDIYPPQTIITMLITLLLRLALVILLDLFHSIIKFDFFISGVEPR